MSCFGSSSSRPTNHCTLLEISSMTYVEPSYRNLPPPREGASMTYIEKTRQVVLFGGMDLDQNLFYNDTWILNTTLLPVINWTQFNATKTTLISDNSTTAHTQNATSDPSGRSFHVASPILSTKVLVWGGLTGSEFNLTGNISVLDVEDQGWLPLSWQPRDDMSVPAEVATYTGISFGMIMFIGMAMMAFLMLLKVARGSGAEESKPSPSLSSSCVTRPVKIYGMSDEDEESMPPLAPLQETISDGPSTLNDGWQQVGRFQVKFEPGYRQDVDMDGDLEMGNQSELIPPSSETQSLESLEDRATISDDGYGSMGSRTLSFQSIE